MICGCADQYRKKVQPFRMGFTLVEIMIAVSIIGVFCSSLYLLYGASVGSFNMSANRSESLQAAYFMYQKLMYEFKMVIVSDRFPIQIESTQGGTNNKISFFVFNRNPQNPASILTEQVVYEFFPNEFSVRRNGALLKPDRFSKVEFVIEGRQAPDSKDVHKLLLRITGIGNQTFLSHKAGTDDERIKRDQVTLAAGFAIPYRTVGEAFPSWKLNNTSLPQ